MRFSIELTVNSMNNKDVIFMFLKFCCMDALFLKLIMVIKPKISQSVTSPSV